MNKIILKGNLTRNVELQTTNNGISVAKFTLAVQRRFKNANGEYETDFINCVAWRNTAEFANKYFSKGSQMLVSGALQIRSYEAEDGTKKYITEVVAEEIEFCGKAESRADNEETFEATATEISDDTLPF